MMLTVKQVADRLSVSATCVYQLLTSGKLPHHRIGLGRGTIRVSETDLSDYVDACRKCDGGKGEASKNSSLSPKEFKHLRFKQRRTNEESCGKLL
jgi:excisionase family DNA binding protein